MDLFECTRLHARISERQCKLNRNGFKSKGVEYPSHISCQDCAGLGEPAQVSLPKQEAEVKQLKHIYCNTKGCYRTVKKEGEFCNKHQGLEDQATAGTVETETPATDNPLPQAEVEQVAVEPATEQIAEEPAVAAEPASKPVFGLAALVRTPPHQQGLLIPFTAIELSVLASCEVTAEHVRELVLMGLAGQLVRAEAA